MALPNNRYLSVDVLRGMTLALMIVVNMSIDAKLSYPPLLHAVWHGLTLTDAVFPTFLFVVGGAMGFSLERYQALGPRVLVGKVIRRGVLILACGVFISNFPFCHLGPDGSLVWQTLSQVRVLGVLQRIGLAYVLAALLLSFAGWRWAVAWSVAALAGYAWVLSAFGDLTLTGNAPVKLDLMVLGASHLYHGEGVPYDPEGLLGLIPATVNLLAGYAAIAFLRRRPATAKTVLQLAAVGGGLILLALAWNTVLPINKKLWTSSYVLCTVGIDLVVLAGLAGLIDGIGVRRGVGYFEIFGKNTLAIYILSEILNAIMWTLPVGGTSLFMWIYAHGFQWAGDRPGSLLLALAMMQLCWLVAWLLDRRRIYIRL